jgi:hypothetical protein
MKTKEEIEQLAERYADGYSTEEAHASYIAFQDGYTQCQEDMVDKKYTELQLRFFANELIKGVEEKNKQGYEDIKVDYESLILSLNKQY